MKKRLAKLKRITLGICLLALGILMVSCSQSNDPGELSLEEEQQILLDLRLAIEALTDEPCTDPADWSYTPFGSKACGGPVSYLAYPLFIDVAAFLEKVEEYRVKQRDFNERWGIISTCDIPVEPIGVDCVDGEAELVFE